MNLRIYESQFATHLYQTLSKSSMECRIQSWKAQKSPCLLQDNGLLLGGLIKPVLMKSGILWS